MGRHLVPLLDATWYIMMQFVMTYHVLGVYEVEVGETGEVKIMAGHPAPDFDGRDWKTWYIFHDDKDLSQPISADTVTETITRILQGAGIDAQ